MGEDDGELRSQRGRNANSGCVAPKHRRIRPRAMSLRERTHGRDKTIVYHEPAPPLPPDHELVGRVGPAAVRGLHGRSLVPRGSTLVLVGDLSPSRALAQATSALSGWTAGARARSLTPPPPTAPRPVLRPLPGSRTTQPSAFLATSRILTAPRANTAER